MYLGRYRQGQEVVFAVTCFGTSRVVALPVAAPTVEVCDLTTKKLIEGEVPANDHAATPGLFRIALFLGTPYTEGSYRAVVRYAVSGVARVSYLYFDVAPGGHPAGSVTAMYQYETAEARHLVHSTDSGRIFTGKNPRVP